MIMLFFCPFTENSSLKTEFIINHNIANGLIRGTNCHLWSIKLESSINNDGKSILVVNVQEQDQDEDLCED